MEEMKILIMNEGIDPPFTHPTIQYSGENELEQKIADIHPDLIIKMRLWDEPKWKIELVKYQTPHAYLIVRSHIEAESDEAFEKIVPMLDPYDTSDFTEVEMTFPRSEDKIAYKLVQLIGGYKDFLYLARKYDNKPLFDMGVENLHKEWEKSKK